MEIAPTPARLTAATSNLLELSQHPTMGRVIRGVSRDQLVELIGDESADRRIALRCDDLRPTDHVVVQLQGEIPLWHVCRIPRESVVHIILWGQEQPQSPPAIGGPDLGTLVA